MLCFIRTRDFYSPKLKGVIFEDIDELPKVMNLVGLNREILTLLGLGSRMWWNYGVRRSVYGVIKATCGCVVCTNLIFMSFA